MSQEFFLSVERSSDEEISESFMAISGYKTIKALIDAMPCFIVIIDGNRQIVFCNKNLLDAVDVNDVRMLVGQRPGEILKCVHTSECDTGCGTTHYCKYCGAGQAIKICQEQHLKVTKECRLSSRSFGALELSVTATPFTLDNRNFTLLTMSDISDNKRRLSLEKTFFHDIVNSAGCISSSLELLDSCDSKKEHDQFIHFAKNASLSLIEEIKFQRTLLAAESKDLVIKIEPCDIKILYEELRELWIAFATFSGVNLAFKQEAEQILTDKNIIKRIIGNLIKNAVEASNSGDTVTVACSESACISVNNPAVISTDIQDQMFQRSFSTKGEGRGIGTYSVKLFTEEYLNGTVSVTSEEGVGTTIYVQL